MKSIIHLAGERGHANYGWLDTHYSFSFANWYDPNRMGFGALRVLNDDVVLGQNGFPTHSHKDFEIITIVLEGSITHEDSLGSKSKVTAGEVQVMSAGTGVTHSEFNLSDETLKLFQIWITPNKKGVFPRYDQKKFSESDWKNKWKILVSDGSTSGSLMINQKAIIARADLDSGKELKYSIADSNGAYTLVIEGEVNVEKNILKKKDAIGIWESESFSIKSTKDSSLLVIEVPMK